MQLCFLGFVWFLVHDNLDFPGSDHKADCRVEGLHVCIRCLWIFI